MSNVVLSETMIKGFGIGLVVGFVFGCFFIGSFVSGPPKPPPTANELRSAWASKCISEGRMAGQAATKEIIDVCTETAAKLILNEKLPDSIPGGYDLAPDVSLK